MCVCFSFLLRRCAAVLLRSEGLAPRNEDPGASPPEAGTGGSRVWRQEAPPAASGWVPTSSGWREWAGPFARLLVAKNLRHPPLHALFRAGSGVSPIDIPSPPAGGWDEPDVVRLVALPGKYAWAKGVWVGPNSRLCDIRKRRRRRRPIRRPNRPSSSSNRPNFCPNRSNSRPNFCPNLSNSRSNSRSNAANRER